MTENQPISSRLIHGDNLEILKSLPSESVDLCYIDPPFFSNANYEKIWGDEGEIRSFKDRWAGGKNHYIDWLKERVEEIHRVLKPTGSFYLHCDHHADAYIRVQILDKIFGESNFINEIAWHYRTGGVSKRYFARKHDTIFFYSKSSKYYFEPLEIKQYYESGRAPAFNDRKRGEDKDGIYNEVYCDDVWNIKPVNSLTKEYKLNGYPTQKPEALLERIINASSKAGDVVLDCFCGGGTTLAVATNLGRSFIGIDASVIAIKVSENRLKQNMHAVFTAEYHKYDYDMLRYADAFKFETWIVDQFGGESNSKQRGDMGIDGKKNRLPIQVKRSDNIGRNIVDNFKSAIERFDSKAYKANIVSKEVAGYIIAFSFSKGAVEEVARLKNEDGLVIELVEVSTIVSLAQKPRVDFTWQDLDLDVRDSNMRVIQFIASSDRDMAGYHWDFNYNEELGFNNEVTYNKNMPTNLRIQKSFKINATYKIALKGFDEDGIEATEIKTLHINGGIKAID